MLSLKLLIAWDFVCCFAIEMYSNRSVHISKCCYAKPPHLLKRIFPTDDKLSSHKLLAALSYGPKINVPACQCSSSSWRLFLASFYSRSIYFYSFSHLASFFLHPSSSTINKSSTHNHRYLPKPPSTQHTSLLPAETLSRNVRVSTAR